jgi:hypothetical protein
MMGHVKLSPRQRERATALRNNLEKSSDWIVLNYSLDTMAVLARQGRQLVPTLRDYLRRYEHSSYTSLSSRARKLLVEFAPRTNPTEVLESRSAGTRCLRFDPTPMLVSLASEAVVYFANRDLLGVASGPVSALWDLPQSRRIVAKQIADGRWRYLSGMSSVRSRQNYDQLETFRQVGVLVSRNSARVGSTRRSSGLPISCSRSRAMRGTFVASTVTSTRPPTPAPSPSCSLKRGTLGTRASQPLFVGFCQSVKTTAAGRSQPAQWAFRSLNSLIPSDTHTPSSPTRPNLRRTWCPAWCCEPSQPTRAGAARRKCNERESFWHRGSTRQTTTATGATQATGNACRFLSGSPTSFRPWTPFHACTSVRSTRMCVPPSSASRTPNGRMERSNYD